MVFQVVKTLFPTGLHGYLVTNICASVAITTTLGFAVFHFTQSASFSFSITLIASFAILYFTLRILTTRLSQSLRALEHGLLTLSDVDYSTTLAHSGIHEIDRCIKQFNDLTTILRNERQYVFQRELLLDTIIEHSGMNVMISDANKRMVYANNLAKNTLNKGQSFTGLPINQALQNFPSLIQALDTNRSGMFAFSEIPDKQFYLYVCDFTLNSSHHKLTILREMTHILSRQEAEAWKNAIRVISHELNNSLAPISSLAHSGEILLQREQYQQLPDIFSTLTERANHITNFVGKYAKLAKLPKPNRCQTNWPQFLQSLKNGYPFVLAGEPPLNSGYFDSAQLHQAIQNLLKNAKESNSPEEEIELEIKQNTAGTTFYVRDRGCGLNDNQIEQVLLPFYSTKPGGSGTGLALCREIAEAHGGSISLTVRPQGGISVRLYIPTDAL